MSEDKKIKIKEIAQELMKAIQPKIDDMKKQIDSMEKKVTAIEGRMQTLSSILMNKRKHNQ